MTTTQTTDPRQWIPALLQRYTRILSANNFADTSLRSAFNSLQFADALLDKLALNQSHPDHALQIVVMGPTQSGKSTLVNTLLDSQTAGISALAGYTVHAQGYASGVSEPGLQQLESCMAPLHRVPGSALDAENLNTYVLETADTGSNALVSSAVIWDTPDFDSIDAGTYQRAVLNAVALADVLVLMVSKDKYGDKSVWDMLELVQPFNQALIVCVNKLDEQDEEVVSNAFNQRYTEQFATQPPPMVLLPFVAGQNNNTVTQFPASRLNTLKSVLADALTNADRSASGPSVEHFIEKHKQQWLSPLINERSAVLHWQELTRQAISEGLDFYSRDYLNNPDKYDTFNRALAELLSLLEIPGLAPTLTRTRQLVTWPARKLFGLGKSTLANQMGTSAAGNAATSAADLEGDTLQTILDSTLITLQGHLLDQPQNPFWLALNRSFRQQEAAIRQSYNDKCVTARNEFEPQIEAAAQRLFAQLQSQPALLNTLRAARATADAAGVALALKSGGLAPADLILAPAMLSVTTLLTESALGRYLDTIKAELKTEQLAHIEQRVFQAVLAQMLIALSSQLDDEQLFGQELEPALIAELEAVVIMDKPENQLSTP